MMPLTSHITAVSAEPVTRAWNCCVWPRLTTALFGSSKTVTLGNGGVPAYPQPPSTIAINDETTGMCRRLRNVAEDCATSAPAFQLRVMHRGPLVLNIFMAALHKRTRCANAM